MDFRDYDPAIARWTGIDPVTHHNMSPYSAFDGNPVFWADPSGADSYDMAMNLFSRSSSGMTTYTPNGNGDFQQSGHIPGEFFTGSFMFSSIDDGNGGGTGNGTSFRSISITVGSSLIGQALTWAYPNANNKTLFLIPTYNLTVTFFCFFKFITKY